MLFVFPVSASDHELVEPLTKTIKKLGPIGNHSAIISSTPTAVKAAQHLQKELQSSFKTVDLFVLDTEPAGGWPKACNIHFRDTAYHIYERFGQIIQPWYWFELDNTPLVRGWADELQKEFNVSGKPFMGVVHPTHFVSGYDEDGKPDTFEQRGSHMVGTGIYPSNLWKRSTMIKFLVEPFDVEMQYEIVADCHNTPLIQHNWSTGSYKRDAKSNKVVCKSLHPGRSPLKHDNPVRDNAVVLHGCKDGSLADVVCRKRNSTK